MRGIPMCLPKIVVIRDNAGHRELRKVIRAAATAAVQPTNDTSLTAETRLAELNNLEAKGLVTKEEHQEQRLRILSAL